MRTIHTYNSHPSSSSAITIVITLLLFLCTSRTFSHSSSFTKTSPPPIPSLPPQFLWTAQIHPPLPQFLTHLCTSATYTPNIPSPHPHPKPLIRLPIILQAALASPRVRGCTFLFVVDKCGLPQPLGWWCPCSLLSSREFYWTKASHDFEKCFGKLAREGRK